MPSTVTRSAVPRYITHADLSCINVPSAASEICLVSGPPSLVKPGEHNLRRRGCGATHRGTLS